MSQAFFAYRFPGNEDVNYFTGRIQKIDTIETADQGILVCSFDRSNIFHIKDLEKIDKQEFHFYYSKNVNNHVPKESYDQTFKDTLDNIKNGRFEKVVLSRTKKVAFESEIMDVFDRLNDKYHGSFNYLLSSVETGCWMGATPELLAEIKDDTLTSVSLAGTKIPEENWSEKEIEEQLYVTNYIKDIFLKLGAGKIEESGPKTISAGPVDHLKSVITANIDPENWKKALEQLHPTPATCGIPTHSSMDFIKQTEHHDRLMYTGFIAVCEPHKKSAFVNLRCMELHPKEATLYLGGGITKKSNADREWQETERKAKTLEFVLK